MGVNIIGDFPSPPLLTNNIGVKAGEFVRVGGIKFKSIMFGAVVTVFSIIGARKRNESFRNNILEFVGSKTKTSMDQQQNDANKGFLVLMCISAGADLILYFIPGIVIGIMSFGTM